jgi:alpha-tubulin suppressor-like RCC1 family protein
VKQVPLVNIFSTDFDNIITRCEEVTFTALGAATYEFFVNGVSQGAASANNTLTSTTLQNNQQVYVRGFANGCPNNSDTIIMVVNQAPPVVINYNTPTTICQGTNVSFVTGGADEYEFYLNGNLVQGPSGVTTYSNAALNNNDKVHVLGYTFGCANSSDTISFTVNTFPVVTLTSSDADNTICLNESVTFSGVGATEYEFFVNGNSQGPPSTTNTFTTTTLLNNQNIRVRGTSNGCATTTSAIIFTVNPLPSISLFSSDLDNAICFGDNITFTALGGSQYEFFVDGISQGAPSNTNTFSTASLPAGTPKVWVLGTQNGCSRAALDTFTINVTALPNVTLLSSDNDNIICNGDTITFTASGASQYRFFVNNVAQGNFSANNTFVSSALTNNQTVRVTGVDNGCISQGTPTYTFTVNAVPNVALASSDIDRVICLGDAVTFTASGADLYQFFIDGTSQGPASNITQIATTALADSNRVRVVGTRNGCSNASGTLLFRVNPLPSVSLTSSDTDNTICAGESITFTGSGANLYQFFVDSTPLSNPSATAARSLTTLTNGQTISLKGINQFGCEALAPQTFTITVNALPNVTLTSSDADNQICSREAVTFTAGGATQYQFFVGSNAATALSNSNTYVADSITNAQTIRVLGISNGCSAFSTSTYTFNVSVFPTVGLVTNATSNIICENDTLIFTASGSNLYEFFINNISLGAPAPTNTFTTNGIQNGQTVSVQGINNNCRSNGNNSFTYTVRPLPVVTVISSDADNRICYGSSITFTASGASDFEYYINGLSQGISANNIFINDELENGDLVTVKGYTNGCGNFSATSFPFIVDKLNLSLTASSTIGMVCENETIQFTANGANLYEFFVDGISQGTSSPINTITFNSLTDGQMVTVEGFSNTTNCTQLADASFTVTVLTTPVMSPALDTAICEGDTITLISNYEKGNQWYKNGNRVIGAENSTLQVFESGVYSLETFRGGNGNVWTIGKNTFGQLGDTTNVSSAETILLPVFENITSLEASINFNIANDASGKVYAWGHNNFGQLGDGTFSDENFPKRIATLNNAKEVAAGNEFSLVLTTAGNIFSFGKNDNGQLGQGNTGTQPFPFQVNNFTNVAHITAGGQHSLALRNDGNVFAWGDNEYGQLGINSFTDKYTPNFVLGLGDVNQISAGENHSLAVKNDGTVWAWGNNANGQLGASNINFSTVAIQIQGINNAIKAVGGYEHTLVLTADGRVFSFGGNTYGQLGNNSTTGTTTPIKIADLYNVKDIYASAFTSFAIKNDGSVWAWGLNIDYQLATGNNTNQLQPAYAKELSGAAIIGAGTSHTAVVANNKVSCEPNAITVTVNAIPDAEIFSTSTGLSTNAGGTSYQWYYNGIAITNGTQQNLPTTSNGNYQVAITNQFGCTTFSNIYSFNVGIATIVGNNPYLKFYPNPTSGLLYVSFNNLAKQEVGKITVVNILGEIVAEIKPEELLMNEAINLTSQASGMYFIHTAVGETIYIDKIILNNF